MSGGVVLQQAADRQVPTSTETVNPRVTRVAELLNAFNGAVDGSFTVTLVEK